MKYYQWLKGNDCCQPMNDCGCKDKDVCDCENILLELSKQHTDDLILREEIDDLSGVVETKQDTLIAGDNISIVDNVISSTASGTSVTVDSELSLISTNPVQNKVITEALNGKLDTSAYTPTDLSNYVTISELTQHILNLQEQLNSLVSVISGCCGETGETQYRWITMTGENDYWCSGTTKYSKEKEQSSNDGISWTDTGNIRNGSTVLEYNCAECGYVPPTNYKFSAEYLNGTSYNEECNGNPTLTSATTKPSGYEYSSMTSAVIGDCITKLDYGVFDGCSGLTSVTIPNSVTKIENAAFYECENLTSVVLPSGLTEIDGYVFNTCLRLTNINIPNNVISIGAGAFAGCWSLQSIDIPDSVTTISGGVFNNCSSLTSVTIGSGVTRIGNEVFYGCTSLQSITINALTPPTLGIDTFNNSNNCLLYVPSQSVAAYQSAWSTYASRIQAIVT